MPNAASSYTKLDINEKVITLIPVRKILRVLAEIIRGLGSPGEQATRAEVVEPEEKRAPGRLQRGLSVPEGGLQERWEGMYCKGLQ